MYVFFFYINSWNCFGLRFLVSEILLKKLILDYKYNSTWCTIRQQKLNPIEITEQATLEQLYESLGYQ